jgi:hypothetical protein
MVLIFYLGPAPSPTQPLDGLNDSGLSTRAIAVLNLSHRQQRGAQCARGGGAGTTAGPKQLARCVVSTHGRCVC